MKQYDAGPGEFGERPWDDPSRKPKPQARRRRVTLPPWALLAILVAAVILLCVLLILIVRAIRGGGDERATAVPTVTVEAMPTLTASIATSTPAVTPTNTVVLPIGATEEPPPLTDIGPGASVVVQGTLGAGLNLREQPSTYAAVVDSLDEGTALTVVDGPREADGYVWWLVSTADGTEGWGAEDWLVLETEEE